MCMVAPEEAPKYKTANMAVMNFFILSPDKGRTNYQYNIYTILGMIYIKMVFIYLQQSILVTKMAFNYKQKPFLDLTVNLNY